MIFKTYTFNPSTRQVTILGVDDLEIEGFKLITNVASGTLIYQFNESTLGGSLAGNVLTLDVDTTAMNSADPLMIIYEAPVASAPVTMDALADIVATLKLMRKYLEPLATQDGLQRQRVVIESLTGINSQVGAANITSVNTVIGGAAAPTVGTATINAVWESPVDQRYRVADAARTMAYIQRQNLVFS